MLLLLILAKAHTRVPMPFTIWKTSVLVNKYKIIVLKMYRKWAINFALSEKVSQNELYDR